MAYKYKIKEEEGHSKYYPGGKTPGLTTDVMNQILKKLADDEDKEVKNELKEEYLSGKSFITSKLSSYPKALSKVNQLIDMMGETNFSMGVAHWVWDFFNNASFESPVNEAKVGDTNVGKGIKSTVTNINPETGTIAWDIDYVPAYDTVYSDFDKLRDSMRKLAVKAKDPIVQNISDIIVSSFNKYRTHIRKTQPEAYKKFGSVAEDGAGGSMSNAAGGYLGKFAYKLPKKQPKLEEETEAPKPNAKNPGASLGAGPAAGKSGVSNNAYVKQFKYKVVPQTAEGTYVQKGSGIEVKKLF
jgi:hypothetical protein